jgi:hypothetical protein
MGQSMILSEIEDLRKLLQEWCTRLELNQEPSDP